MGYVGEYDSRYLVQPGDLLVGMDGDFNCARWRGPEALLNQRVCKITPDQEQLDLHFLIHLLPGYLRAIHDLTSSTTVTHLSSRDVAQIPIPVPSLEEQHGLAQLFEGAVSKQQSSTRHLVVARRAISRFRQAVLAAACSGRLTADWRETWRGPSGVDLLTKLEERSSDRRPRQRRGESPSDPVPTQELPEGWVWARLSKLASSIEYGYTASSTLEPIGPRMLRITDIQDEKVDWESVPYCRIEPSRAEKYRLTQGDLLFARTGATTGKSYLVRSQPSDAVFASYLIRVRLHGNVNPDYVSIFFRSLLYWQQIMDASVGTGQPNVNGTKLANLWVPVSSQEEQAEIVRRVNELLGLADGLNARIDVASTRVDRSFQAVLAKAFRGELMLAGVDS